MISNRLERLACSWYTICIVAIICLGSCHVNERQEATISWGDSLVFDTGFPLVQHLSGVCGPLDAGDTSECVYFADVATHKKITVFSSKGQLLHTVPLGEALDSLRRIAGVIMLHPDTILLLGSYNNKIAIIDRLGHCSALADLSGQLLRPDGLAYELWPSFFSPFVLQGRACLHVSLLGNSIARYNGLDAPHGNDVYTYEWLNRNGPHFVSLDLAALSDSTAVQWGPVEMNKDTAQAVAVINRFGSYACVNGHWFTYSINSPMIQVLNPASMAMETEFEVRSASSDVYREPIMFPKEGLEAYQDSVNDRLYNGGFIETLHFDWFNRRYLVVLRHRVVKPPGLGREHWRTGYTVQEYDEGLNLIQEVAVTDNKHLMPYMLCLQGGTYVRRMETKRESMSGIHVFDRMMIDGK